MKHRQRVVYITAAYPYGQGEKTFVKPELDALRQFFDVTILSLAHKSHLDDTKNRSSLPGDTRLVLSPPAGRLRTYLDAMVLLFSPLGWRELQSLVSDGLSMARIVDSAFAFARGKSILRTMRKEGLLDDSSLYYSFWFGNALVALALAKRRMPSLRVCARTNGADLYNERNRHGRQPFQRIKRDVCSHVFFSASRPLEEFVSAFGGERHKGQYVLNRLGVSKVVPTPTFEPPKRHSTSKRLIVSCSSVIPLKRVMLIAQSLSKLDEHHPVRWVHFGDGPELEAVREYAHEQGLDADFRGHVSNDEIRSFYQRNYVDAFVSTSSTEGGSPVSIQEALAAGIPVVGTDVGGIPDTIGDNGVLLSATPDASQVLQAICDVAFAPERQATAMHRASYEIWRERFDQDANKAQLISVLSQLLR